MPILNERDYAKLANAAAKDLVEHQIPLNESVEKLAASHDMNDEQIARLCEATNNTAFNAVFEAKGKQGSDDRLVEFKVASTKEILQKRVGAEKTAGARQPVKAGFDPLWESRPLRSASTAREEEKTASDSAPLPTTSQLRRYAIQDENALHKAVEHLRHEKIAQEMELGDNLSRVVRIFRPMYAQEQFPLFEKEAMRLHGSAADVLLDYVRDELRLPAVTRDHVKVAGMVVVNDETLPHTFLKQALAARERIANIHSTLARHERG